MKAYNQLIENLKVLANSSYKTFSEKIAKSNYEMLGVKIPTLKSFAKKIFNSDVESFLNDCEFRYFEDVLIYGLVVAKLEYEKFLNYLPKYLAKVDSWSHVDSFVPAVKSIKKHKGEFLDIIKKNVLMASGFYLRFYIVCLMVFYLEENYLDFIFSTIEKCDKKGYYSDMAIAWLISVAYVKFKDNTFKFIKNCKLSSFTLNKAISKINDSFRVSREDKILLQNYIRKN